MPQAEITAAVGADDTTITVDATDALDFAVPQYPADLDGEPVIVLAGPPASGTWEVQREAAASELVSATLFEQVVADGLGQTLDGYDWKFDLSTADMTVETDGTKAIVTAVTAAGRRVPRLVASLRDTETRIHVRYPALPVGAGFDVYPIARAPLTTNEMYTAQFFLPATGIMTTRLKKTDSGGSDTAITSFTGTGITITAGEGVWLVLQAYGESPTTLRQKAWKDTDPEPTTWIQSTTDSQAELQDASYPGFIADAEAALTSLPFVVEVLDFQVRQIPPGVTHAIGSFISTFDEWPLPPGAVVGSGPPTQVVPDGCLYADAETNTFYVRVRGVWRSVALT